MKRWPRCALALLVAGSLSSMAWAAQAQASGSTLPASAPELIEQMRGLDMRFQPGGNRLTANEQHRREIIKELRALGKEAAVPALVQGLKDPDAKLRGNAALALVSVANGSASEGVSKMDIRAALPALTKEVGDEGNLGPQAWAGQAIAAIGPEAKEAVPELIELLKRPDSGCRQGSAMALRGIGPVAKDALPALRDAQNDPDEFVRHFAALAIGSIQKQ